VRGEEACGFAGPVGGEGAGRLLAW
jgi:hypothetical protein